MKSSRSLILRYLFPVNLLETPHGDMYMQRSLLLANVDALRRWMPHYFKVHAKLAVVLALLLMASTTYGAPWWLEVMIALVDGVEVLFAIAFGATAIATRLPTSRGY